MKNKKDEIIKDVLSEFQAKHKGVHTETQHSKCIRDTGYNFDAIVSDLETGGIKNVIEVARRYWDGTKSNLGKGEQNYAIEVNNLLEQRLHKETLYKAKVSLLINIINEIVHFGIKSEKKYSGGERDERYKYMLYDWDNEMDIIRDMQKCQRNWDLSKRILPEVRDYLLWVAQNAPSKQFEAYYDVHWSTDRKVIEDLYQHAWGSTHTRNPPACWRNSQMNANMYMLFVMKQPKTMFNCENDGRAQKQTGPSRWENAIVQIGMGMSLVMQAANRCGLQTGPNKVIDLGPDYKGYWGKKLGIEDDLKQNRKKLIYGLGIGFENKGRPRWESDDTELALGASNGHNITELDENHPDWKPVNEKGEPFRKVKIVDIKECAGQEIKDPYGNVHKIPEKHEIKINTVRVRDIKEIMIK